MGGGSGGQVTQNASYAPEFRPIAEAAGDQVLKLIEAAPVWRFAAPANQGTAGLSPWQQFGMSIIPYMGMTTEPMRQFGNIPTPVSAAALGSAAMGDVTPAAQRSLASFDKYGGVGTNAFNPQRETMFSTASQSIAGSMPWNYQQSWMFPGLEGVPASPDSVGMINAALAAMPTQVLYGTPTGTTTTPPIGAYNTYGPSPIDIEDTPSRRERTV